MDAVEALDWGVIVMADPTKGHVPGLVIGEKGFLESLEASLRTLEDAMSVPIKEITPKMPKSTLKPKKDDDDPTYH